MSKKIGVYIYTGDGIKEAIDVDKLVELATGELGATVAKTHENLYSPDGVAMVKQDVESEGLNAIVIAGVSPRHEFKEFDFPGVYLEKLGLRELVAWSHQISEDDENADAKKEHVQELAEDYIRMAVTKVQKAEMPEPDKMEQPSDRILVIGGGVTGMTAALEAAEAGYKVTIVEREPELGGFAAKLRKQLPLGPDYSQLVPPLVQDLISKVQSNDNIEVKTSTEVARIANVPGDYRVSFKEAGTKSEWDAPVPLTDEEKLDENGNELPAEELKKKYEEKNEGRKEYTEVDPNAEVYGAVIVASGWKPYVPAEGEFEHLAWGNPNVVTNCQFEELAKAGKVKRPSDGKEVKAVAFIQSPGGKDDDADFPYASAVTSLVSLKQAKYVREDQPEEGKAYIFYQHMRTPGQYEYFYKGLQDDPGIFLAKGSVTEVKDNGQGGLTVNVENTLLGDSISVDVDMVVLATGMVPTTRDEAVVNLAYRQGPAFRDLDLFGGYCDSNFICFPYETRRTGIYAAGGVHRSMTIKEAMEDAAGAALKAVQCIKAAQEGHAVHPRTWDYDYPSFYFQRCTQCKRCTEECPFGALDDDEKGTPKPNPTRCRRCGTCMGACPERIIGFKDYNIDVVGSMIKAIEVPDDDDEKLRMIVFACENDAYPCLDMAASKGYWWSPLVRIIPVRCLGSVNVAWIKDAMSSGMDGALLLGCRFGDDYQCHFVKGSELANRRMENVAETLNSLGMEPERVKLAQVAIDEYDKVPEIINNFVDEIMEMGPNPFKGW
ncbi:Adenylylsulfate reductase-associated electron transfer protein QmoB [Dissulfuribacter thermophilus]|uniref:Adenylylsulfate reductase-associated electron transfer protein QmoB n=1 Tax=Dissulfuribacter thermophilus TaxID=1156395 RepID=A0A1B9F5A6_9BACT|nr:FAD-dependent oxidoreductase [Dissulfuribacter thermophilus]OCC14995.1 Adenylylsulfate reductase-associated electron transfer protein QmoB [Dissulfuribacter thermophilus]